jgi:hypothetical protein
VSGKRNLMCSCHKSGAYSSRRQAEEALRRVQDAPFDPDDPRPYRPTSVVRCVRVSGVWHLTSNSGKLWKSGKPRRRRAR